MSCTPLIGIGGRITSDFSNMSRHEGNAVVYEKEFYSGILRGYFSLDLDVVGRFTSTSRSGFQNINEAGLEEARSMGAEVADGVALMDAETREARVTDVLSVLPYLSGGANQTLHLTDVSPKLVILAVVRGGNPLFMNVVHEVRGRGRINTDALAEVLTAYHDRFETNVYIGRRAGFLDEQARELADLAHAHNDLVNLSSLNLAINNFTEEISNVMVAS